MHAMKLRAFFFATLVVAATVCAQTPEPAASPAGDEAVMKKLDELNTKVDALSQQLLKIEQQINRPGVMIGEATPGNSPSPAAAMPVTTAGASGTHVVAKGETLTSIAKQNKVSVEELQKFNHIEDGRKLQAGQTILIPVATATPPPSPTATP